MKGQEKKKMKGQENCHSILGNTLAGIWEPTHYFLLVVDESVFQQLAH